MEFCCQHRCFQRNKFVWIWWVYGILQTQTLRSFDSFDCFFHLQKQQQYNLAGHMYACRFWQQRLENSPSRLDSQLYNCFRVAKFCSRETLTTFWTQTGLNLNLWVFFSVSMVFRRKWVWTWTLEILRTSEPLSLFFSLQFIFFRNKWVWKFWTWIWKIIQTHFFLLNLWKFSVSAPPVQHSCMATAQGWHALQSRQFHFHFNHMWNPHVCIQALRSKQKGVIASCSFAVLNYTAEYIYI